LPDTIQQSIILGQHATGAGKEFIDNLARYVDNLGRSSWATLENGLLQLADPGFTLGALGLLAAKSRSTELGNHLDGFLVQVSTFLAAAEAEQLRLNPLILVELCSKLSEALLARGIPIRGIRLMMAAVQKLQAHPRQLTSIHALLMELCLSAKCLKTAQPFIIDDIEDFSLELRGSDCKALLLYFYYSGLIYAGLKNFRQSLYFFEACIRVPAVTMSHIMLEAFKKFLLISLISNGEIPPTPKSALQVVNRILKPNATAYVDIATAFVTYNPVELNNVITKHQDLIRRDENHGLIKQVQSAQTKSSIKRLTKTFLTLSLADVASRAQLAGGPQQAEKYILSMIQDGEIYAKINQKDGMVVFLDNKEKYDSPKMMQKIENQIAVCVELNKRLGNMNERLATNPDYISKVSLGNEEEGISSSKIPSYNI
jgi:COP9 signalosome complex subunit 3